METTKEVLLQWSNEILHKTSPLNLIILSTLVLFSFNYLLKLTKTYKLNPPPSPPKLPLIGNLHQLSILPHVSLRDLANKHGPLMLMNFGTVPTLIVSGSEVLREIAKNHDLVFSGRPRVKSADIYFYGYRDIAFCPYGEYWRQVKKICILEILSQKRVQDFADVREIEVVRMHETFRVSCEEKSPVDLTEMFTDIANNVISLTSLGRILEKREGQLSFGDLAKETVELMATFSFQDSFPFIKWMDFVTGLHGRLKKNLKGWDNAFEEIIAEHELASNQSRTGKKDIVDILLEIIKEKKLDIDFTKQSIKAILIDLIVAGTDTSSTTLEWAMAELIKNPRAMKKVQEEVRTVLNGKSRVDESDLVNMPYMKSVIKEALRLHPPAALIMRETSSDCKVMGYDIPAKTNVIVNIWSVQRDPNAWEHPEEFIPERFLDANIDYRDQTYRFVAFGAGRRMCPGITYGIAETEIVLANALYFYDWEIPDGVSPQDFDMSESSQLVVRKKTPLRLIPVKHTPSS